MLIATIAGNTGKDAEYKTTQGGAEFCSFSVACKVGYGNNEQTYWVDVTRWGKGARGLADILGKGSKVTVIGELSTREHNGKTYLQCRADHVSIHGTPGGNRASNEGQGGGGSSDGGSGGGWNQGGGGSNYDDMDDDIPF